MAVYTCLSVKTSLINLIARHQNALHVALLTVHNAKSKLESCILLIAQRMATLLNTNAHFTVHSAQLSGVLPSRLSGTLILQSLILVRLYLSAADPPSAYRGTATFPVFWC